MKPQTAKGILPFNLIFNAHFQKFYAEIPSGALNKFLDFHNH